MFPSAALTTSRYLKHSTFCKFSSFKLTLWLTYLSPLLNFILLLFSLTLKFLLSYSLPNLDTIFCSFPTWDVSSANSNWLTLHTPLSNRLQSHPSLQDPHIIFLTIPAMIASHPCHRATLTCHCWPSSLPTCTQAWLCLDRNFSLLLVAFLPPLSLSYAFSRSKRGQMQMLLFLSSVTRTESSK